MQLDGEPILNNYVMRSPIQRWPALRSLASLYFLRPNPLCLLGGSLPGGRGELVAVNINGGTRRGAVHRRRHISVAVTGTCLIIGFLGLCTAPAHGSVAGSQMLQVSPSAVTAGSATALTLTYRTSSASEVKGAIILTIPSGWSGTPSVNTADCAAAGCVIGQPRVSGSTVTMPSSYLPPGQEFQISYDNATPPAAPGNSYFTVTANGNTISALVTVVCGNGVGTMGVTPPTAPDSGTHTFIFTYTAAGCGLLPGGEVSLDVPDSWPSPGQTAGSLSASSGTVTVSGRQITAIGATLPAGGNLTLHYTTAVPATPGTAVFPALEQTAKGGTLTPLTTSPQISLLPPVRSSPSQPGSGSHTGSGSNHNGHGSGRGTHPAPRHHGRGSHRERGSHRAVDVSHSSPLSHGMWLLVILLGALLLAAGIISAAAATQRARGRSRFRPGSMVRAVPNLGPVHPPVVRTTAGDQPLVVRIEPHPGSVLIRPSR